MSIEGSHSAATGMNRLQSAPLTIAYVVTVVGVPMACTDLALHPFLSPKLMALAVAAACSCVAVSFQPAALSLRHIGLRGLALLVLVTVASLSFLASDTPGPSLWGSCKQEVGFLAAMACLVVALAFSMDHHLPFDAPHLWALPILSSTLLALMALAGAAGVPLPEFLRPGGPDAMGGTVGLPSALSSLLSAFAVFAIGQAVIRGRPWRLWLISAAALSLGAASLTGWLPGLLGFVFSATFMLVCWAAPSRRTRLGLVGTGMVLVTGLIAAMAVRPGYITPTGATGGWGWIGEVFTSAGRIAGRNPFLGQGPASFQPSLVPLLTPDTVHAFFSQELPGDAHNWLLELAATYGILCAVIVAYFIARPFTVTSRIPRTTAPYATAALCLVIAGLFGPLSLSTLPVIALFIGITWAGVGVQSTQSGAFNPIDRSAAGHLARVFLRVLAAAVVAAAGIFLVLGAHFLRTEVDSRCADLTSSLPAAEAAAERLRPPTAPAFWSAARIAAFEARIGADTSAAASVDKLMAQAEAVDPRDPYTQLNWAVSLQMLERHHDAISHLAEGLRLYPGWPLALKGIAFSYIDLGQPGAALAILEPLVEAYPDDAVARRLLDAARGADAGN